MKKLIIFAMALIYIVPLFAQDSKVKRPDSYNYQRGMEALQNENTEEALEYFNKEVDDNPKNGYAYSWIALLRDHQEEYGRALTAVNLAIKNIPKKDAEFLAATYNIRANVYLELNDTISALNDYASAIKVLPSYDKSYEKRAQIYYEQSKYDLADADYKQLINLDEADVMGYMGIGRNRNAQKQWDAAIEQFNYVVNLYDDYSSAYSFRAEAYIGKEKWAEATDDIVKALSLNGDNKAFVLMQDLKEPAFSMLKAKMKIQSAKSPNNAYWPYCIGVMHEHNEEYAKAIPFYEEAQSKDADDMNLRRIAQCYYELGNYDKALIFINQAIELDSTKVQYIPFKANVLYEMGKPKEAIAEWDKHQALYPEYGFGYYRRGWFKSLSGDDDGAIDDFTMSVTLDPEYSYSYVSRGDVYARQGKTELAKADYKKVIELEDSPEKYDCIHYAYQGLGEYDKAIAAMDSIIARDSTDSGNYYDAACLYSRMKDKDNALKHLEKSLQLGYNRFAHIERDFDMDFLRETEEFKALLEKYKTQNELNGNQSTDATLKGETVTSEIPFVKEDGVCKVKCKINDLPLHFVFDTGASDVTLSMVEATFMMKNGYLTGSDVIGSKRYMDANGDVSVGTVINLKNVNFGGLDLNNVRASVVRNQKAPLLLGQSVLGRLGKIEIDNSKHILKITHLK